MSLRHKDSLTERVMLSGVHGSLAWIIVGCGPLAVSYGGKIPLEARTLRYLRGDRCFPIGQVRREGRGGLSFSHPHLGEYEEFPTFY